MNWRTLAVVLSLLWTGQAMGQSAVAARVQGLREFWSGRVCPGIGCCVDDYCRKADPAIVPLSRCGGPDDYCRKRIPCLFDINRLGTCDDYCRKSMPSLLCPPFSSYLRCLRAEAP